MKLISKSLSQNLYRSVLIASMATLAVGCGSSSSDDTVGVEDNTDTTDTTDPTDTTGASNTDEYSLTSGWSDNKWISVSSYASSSYSKGIQRIIYCLGSHPENQSIAQFADGIFGPNTKAAVEDFQENRGIAVDGVVGDETWGALQDVVEIDSLVDTGDGFNARSIDGNSCGTEAQFYQSQSTPFGWKMAKTPSSTEKVQFSVGGPNEE